MKLNHYTVLLLLATLLSNTACLGGKKGNRQKMGQLCHSKGARNQLRRQPPFRPAEPRQRGMRNRCPLPLFTPRIREYEQPVHHTRAMPVFGQPESPQEDRELEAWLAEIRARRRAEEDVRTWDEIPDRLDDQAARTDALRIQQDLPQADANAPDHTVTGEYLHGPLVVIRPNGREMHLDRGEGLLMLQLGMQLGTRTFLMFLGSNTATAAEQDTRNDNLD